jgi:hypothetical protein
MAKHKQWYVTRKPSNEYVMYDFARSAAQAKDMLRDLSEGSPIAHRSKSEGGLYNIYVKKGSVYWREKGGGVDYFTRKDGSKISKDEWYKGMEDKLGFEKFAERILKDSQFGRTTSMPKNEFKHNRNIARATIEDDFVFIDHSPKGIKENQSGEMVHTFKDLRKLTEFLQREKIYAHGGKMKQGYNDRMDDSLGNRTGKASSKEQDYKDRRDEAKAMNKAEGKRAYQSVGTMDKMAHGGKVLSPKQRMFKNVLEDLEKQGHLDMPNPTRDIHHIASTSVTTSTGVKKQLKELRRLKHLDLSDNNINIIASKFGKMAHGGSIGAGAYILRLYEDSHDKVIHELGYDGMQDYLDDLNKRGIGYAEFEDGGGGMDGEGDAIYTHDTEVIDELENEGLAFKTYSTNYAHGGSIGKAKKGNKFKDEQDVMGWSDAEAERFHKSYKKHYGSKSIDDVISYVKSLDLKNEENEKLNIESDIVYYYPQKDLDKYEKEIGFTKSPLFKKGGKTDDWIQGVEAEMKKKGTVGAFTKQAKRAGMTVKEFTKEVLDNPDKYSKRTRERAQFAKNVSKYESGGDVGGWETNPNGTHYNLSKGGSISSNWFSGGLSFLNW